MGVASVVQAADLLDDGGDVLLIVPPFTDWTYGSIACHLLQACARREGIEARVLYANLLLAAEIGTARYKAMTFDYQQLIGERLFSRVAYDVAPFGLAGSEYQDQREQGQPLTGAELRQLEEQIEIWTESVADAVVQRRYGLVGVTTSFQQTAASVALLNRIKLLDPNIVSFVGGANCEGEMAHGILSLGARIDHVFAGESEATFPDFARQLLTGSGSPPQIIQGTPCTDLDALPTPDYSEYYAQLRQTLPDALDNEPIWQPYETSRGCWWGRKSHCTFCGLNAQGMAYREKSPDRVIAELRELLARAPTRRIITSDNIMPYAYLRTLLPRLAEELPDLHIHYECKANLSFQKLLTMRKAGIRLIQPGIEALSTALLERMAKGVSALQNLALLRYCRMLDFDVLWNLLCHFPGDQRGDYEKTLELMPFIRHLPPPSGLFPLSIDRFSPYFDQAQTHGLSNLRPASMYEAFLPAGTDVQRLAYHFQADYDSGSRQAPELMAAIREAVKYWKTGWQTAPVPNLLVNQMAPAQFMLVDTRGLSDQPELEFIDLEQAQLALCPSGNESGQALEWALNRRVGVQLDKTYVPLATCDPELFLSLQARTLVARRTARQARLEGMDAVRSPNASRVRSVNT